MAAVLASNIQNVYLNNFDALEGRRAEAR